MPLGLGNFACTVNGDTEGERAFCRADLRAVEMEVTDRL
jgi:hypothetical protein